MIGDGGVRKRESQKVMRCRDEYNRCFRIMKYVSQMA